MIAFDETARTLHLSVDDLLDAGPHRPWDDEIDPGRERLAADALARYLDAQAPDGYRTGVAAEIEFSWRDYQVHLSGRADGVFDTERGAVAEVLRCVPASGGAERAVERASFLCLLLHHSGTAVGRGRVVELSLLEDPAVTPLDVAFSVDGVERLLGERLARIERNALGLRRRARRGHTLGDDLPFPYETMRPGQDVMVRDVDGAIENGLVLLCSAPTGIGKTAAALHPMLKRALAEDRKVFFVTSKVSQQALALDTLRQMLPAGSGALAVQVSARDRVCPTEELGCLPGRCPLMRGFLQRMDDSGVYEELAESGVADGETIARRGRDVQVCPFELSLELARDASVIVGDFNYVFDPNVYLRRFFDHPYDRALLVVDEAHNLPARAQDYYSPTLDLPSISALAQRCASLTPFAYRGIAALLREVVDHCTRFAESLSAVRGDAPPWVEAPEREFWEELGTQVASASLDYFAQVAIDGRPPSLSADAEPIGSGGNPFAARARARLRSSSADPLRDALRSIRDFSRFAGADPERTAAIWTPTSAKLLCLDPAPHLGERIAGFHAAVCMSATLHPPEFWVRSLGIDRPRTVQLDLPSPFPAENRRLLVVPTVDTTYRRRSEDAPKIAELIERCMAVRRGNYLAFFSSFAFRDEVISHLGRAAGRVLVQVPGMPTAPFLRQLEQNRDDTLLLCAVHGGVFSEGVDYPAHMAIGVFVIGPGLPAVSLERELIREHLEHEPGGGFAQAYVAPGMNRVVQAGGRAIRTPTDRAAIVLLGRRFAEPEYVERMPGWWRDERIESADPVAELKAFWESAPRAADLPAGD